MNVTRVYHGAGGGQGTAFVDVKNPGSVKLVHNHGPDTGKGESGALLKISVALVRDRMVQGVGPVWSLVVKGGHGRVVQEVASFHHRELQKKNSMLKIMIIKVHCPVLLCSL
jgi:hypothetical protein